MAIRKVRKGSKKGAAAKAKRLEKRYNALGTKKAKRGFSLARKAASIVNKVKGGQKLTKRDARTMAAFRKWKNKHKKQRKAKLSRAQKQGIKKATRSYTTAERRRAAIIGWVKRRRKYGKSGRADPASFQKAADTRRKNGGGSTKKSGGKSSGKKSGGKAPKGAKTVKKHKNKNWVRSLMSTVSRMVGRRKK